MNSIPAEHIGTSAKMVLTTKSMALSETKEIILPRADTMKN